MTITTTIDAITVLNYGQTPDMSHMSEYFWFIQVGNCLVELISYILGPAQFYAYLFFLQLKTALRL